MYRAILTPQNERKQKFECISCGTEEMLHSNCPVTGTPAGEGFEHVCTECRGTMVAVKNPLLGD